MFVPEPGVGEGGVAATQPAVATSAALHNGHTMVCHPALGVSHPRLPAPIPSTAYHRAVCRSALPHVTLRASVEAGMSNRTFIFNGVCRELQGVQILTAGAHSGQRGVTDSTDLSGVTLAKMLA